MTIIDIIREHVEYGAPWDEHGRCHIVLSKDDAHALRMTDGYQRGARFLRDVATAEPPTGCSYVATLQFTRQVNVYEWLGALPPMTVAHVVTTPRPVGPGLTSDPADIGLDAEPLSPAAILDGFCGLNPTVAPADPEPPPEQTPPD